ncbi:metallophosphoesterase [Sporolactobacillus terrae]|uniref:Metallophosphoesterase n=2 Tax=Sporolactobacillus terrae TaxID=269673 RepID=A0ABX5Q7N0_9BACL|nr:metallophosphoesterase [Sporolactobacillus terrae]QAA22632.1 metallophosphoesterase [Sporolactobacillus terrae]QAA25606.1 metallophosphoesterase [Sporolactobacillus terrae]UAK17415.1 metallophosphoesterase family protein [Sporolactobacillus terrae]
MMVTFLAALLIGAAVLLLGWMFLEGHLNRVLTLDLEFADLPDPFIGKHLFFISDIHRRRISESWLNALKKSMDYVVIGGDLTEKGVPLKRVEANLRLLTSCAPVFFVWGNHDREAKTQQIKTLLDQYAVTVIENATYIIDEQGYSLNFCGIDDLLAGQPDLEQVLNSRRSNAPTVLFSHNPDIKHELNGKMKIDYVISGHTHSGQINFFGFTLKEKAGVKKLPFGTLIISSGYGTTKIPLRLGAKPDVLLLTLQRNRL